MHRKRKLILPSIVLFALILALFSPACGNNRAEHNAAEEPPEPERPFDIYDDYDQWTESEGYGSGALIPQGPEGLYQDYYHTLPDDPAYTSGRIVIGDSRCCQLGIYEQRAGRNDFAAFAVWGGHYNGAYPSIMTEGIVSDIEACFRAQIRACGTSTVFFFATVNDYDRTGARNAENIAAAIEAAEYFASMEYEANGRTYRPQVVVIGFDGCRAEGSFYGEDPAEFNRNIGTYNEALREAAAASPLLSPGISRFSTVPEIMGGNCGFINDALHYDDRTLKAICDFIIGGES